MTSGVVDDERSGERTKKRAGSFEGSRPAFDSEVEVKVWARLARLARLARRLVQERQPVLVRRLARVELPVWVRGRLVLAPARLL
jgi:hypothetical protein